jgi:hypothetical protein
LRSIPRSPSNRSSSLAIRRGIGWPRNIMTTAHPPGAPSTPATLVTTTPWMSQRSSLLPTSLDPGWSPTL